MKNKIALYTFYFGKLPDWIDLYLHTLKKNPSIDFFIFTDSDIQTETSDNIFIKRVDYNDYLYEICEKLNVTLKVKSPVKLCDFRPFLGVLHRDIFAEYDFYGWTDMDILFGDIRSFYTDDILQKHDVFSTHESRISGHLAVFKNTKKNRNMYKKIYKWKYFLEKTNFIGIDEHGLTNAYMMTIFDKFNEKFNLKIDNWLTRKVKKWKTKTLYMKEQFSTPFLPLPWIDGTLNSNQPDEWYYDEGIITNKRDGSRSFMYLHFMNFKSSKWRHDGTKAPWEDKKEFYQIKPKDIGNNIIINKKGILLKQD